MKKEQRFFTKTDIMSVFKAIFGLGIRIVKQKSRLKKIKIIIINLYL